jgi:low affinity Fe/Cu permease|tara:strand:+ start:820 stop:1074 length:255 start_codon:yes stop_codon:yes gene_type:complete
MEVKQVINGGRLTGSYMSSWNMELQLTVEGGHEITVKLDESVLRDLQSRLNERIETIDKEREEERQAELAKLQEEAEEAVTSED